MTVIIWKCASYTAELTTMWFAGTETGTYSWSKNHSIPYTTWPSSGNRLHQRMPFTIVQVEKRISEFLPGLELRITIFQFLTLSRSLLQDLHSDVENDSLGCGACSCPHEICVYLSVSMDHCHFWPAVGRAFWSRNGDTSHLGNGKSSRSHRESCRNECFHRKGTQMNLEQTHRKVRNLVSLGTKAPANLMIAICVMLSSICK